MKIREVSTSRLREYENNPRNNDLAVEKVKYSIERFKILFPVIIDMNYVIICGHTRVRACRELGISSVPCIIIDDLTEEQINFFRLVDNKTSEYTDWDFEKLKNELSLVDLTIEENQLMLERFELSAEVFDIDAEQAEIKIPAFNFMGVNDRPKERKTSVRTIINDTDEPEEEVSNAEENIDEFYQRDFDDEETSNYTALGDDEPEHSSFNQNNEVEEKPKKSKAILQFCQFRFGDVAFFISQVELDRLNSVYQEYIDSGAILEGSFASYLLKGVENND